MYLGCAIQCFVIVLLFPYVSVTYPPPRRTVFGYISECIEPETSCMNQQIGLLFWEIRVVVCDSCSNVHLAHIGTQIGLTVRGMEQQFFIHVCVKIQYTEIQKLNKYETIYHVCQMLLGRIPDHVQFPKIYLPLVPVRVVSRAVVDYRFIVNGQLKLTPYTVHTIAEINKQEINKREINNVYIKKSII